MRHIPEYAAWRNAKSRCLNSNHRKYPDYGGRGITFHEPWIKDFPAFLAHIGPRPSASHSLGRIDNDGGYEPGNLEWQTKQEQAAATRKPRKDRLDFGLGKGRKNSPLISFEGKTQTMAQWAEELGLKRATLYDRLIAGMSILEAFNPNLLPRGGKPA